MPFGTIWPEFVSHLASAAVSVPRSAAGRRRGAPLLHEEELGPARNVASSTLMTRLRRRRPAPSSSRATTTTEEEAGTAALAGGDKKLGQMVPNGINAL